MASVVDNGCAEAVGAIHAVARAVRRSKMTSGSTDWKTLAAASKLVYLITQWTRARCVELASLGQSERGRADAPDEALSPDLAAAKRIVRASIACCILCSHLADRFTGHVHARADPKGEQLVQALEEYWEAEFPASKPQRGGDLGPIVKKWTMLLEQSNGRVDRAVLVSPLRSESNSPDAAEGVAVRDPVELSRAATGSTIKRDDSRASGGEPHRFRGWLAVPSDLALLDAFPDVTPAEGPRGLRHLSSVSTMSVQSSRAGMTEALLGARSVLLKAWGGLMQTDSEAGGEAMELSLYPPVSDPSWIDLVLLRALSPLSFGAMWCVCGDALVVEDCKRWVATQVRALSTMLGKPDIVCRGARFLAGGPALRVLAALVSADAGFAPVVFDSVLELFSNPFGTIVSQFVSNDVWRVESLLSDAPIPPASPSLVRFALTNAFQFRSDSVLALTLSFMSRNASSPSMSGAFAPLLDSLKREVQWLMSLGVWNDRVEDLSPGCLVAFGPCGPALGCTGGDSDSMQLVGVPSDEAVALARVTAECFLVLLHSALGYHWKPKASSTRLVTGLEMLAEASSPHTDESSLPKQLERSPSDPPEVVVSNKSARNSRSGLEIRVLRDDASERASRLTHQQEELARSALETLLKLLLHPKGHSIPVVFMWTTSSVVSRPETEERALDASPSVGPSTPVVRVSSGSQSRRSNKTVSFRVKPVRPESARPHSVSDSPVDAKPEPSGRKARVVSFGDDVVSPSESLGDRRTEPQIVVVQSSSVLEFLFSTCRVDLTLAQAGLAGKADRVPLALRYPLTQVRECSGHGIVEAAAQLCGGIVRMQCEQCPDKAAVEEFFAKTPARDALDDCAKWIEGELDMTCRLAQALSTEIDMSSEEVHVLLSMARHEAVSSPATSSGGGLLKRALKRQTQTSSSATDSFWSLPPSDQEIIIIALAAHTKRVSHRLGNLVLVARSSCELVAIMHVANDLARMWSWLAQQARDISSVAIAVTAAADVETRKVVAEVQKLTAVQAVTTVRVLASAVADAMVDLTVAHPLGCMSLVTDAFESAISNSSNPLESHRTGPLVSASVVALHRLGLAIHRSRPVDGVSWIMDPGMVAARKELAGRLLPIILRLAGEAFETVTRDDWGGSVARTDVSRHISITHQALRPFRSALARLLPAYVATLHDHHAAFRHPQLPVNTQAVRLAGRPSLRSRRRLWALVTLLRLAEPESVSPIAGSDPPGDGLDSWRELVDQHQVDAQCALNVLAALSPPLVTASGVASGLTQFWSFEYGSSPGAAEVTSSSTPATVGIDADVIAATSPLRGVPSARIHPLTQRCVGLLVASLSVGPSMTMAPTSDPRDRHFRDEQAIASLVGRLPSTVQLWLASVVNLELRRARSGCCWPTLAYLVAAWPGVSDPVTANTKADPALWTGSLMSLLGRLCDKACGLFVARCMSLLDSHEASSEVQTSKVLVALRMHVGKFIAAVVHRCPLVRTSAARALSALAHAFPEIILLDKQTLRGILDLSHAVASRSHACSSNPGGSFSSSEPLVAASGMHRPSVARQFASDTMVHFQSDFGEFESRKQAVCAAELPPLSGATPAPRSDAALSGALNVPSLPGPIDASLDAESIASVLADVASLTAAWVASIWAHSPRCARTLLESLSWYEGILMQERIDLGSHMGLSIARHALQSWKGYRGLAMTESGSFMARPAGSIRRTYDRAGSGAAVSELTSSMWAGHADRPLLAPPPQVSRLAQTSLDGFSTRHGLVVAMDSRAMGAKRDLHVTAAVMTSSSSQGHKADMVFDAMELLSANLRGAVNHAVSNALYSVGTSGLGALAALTSSSHTVWLESSPLDVLPGRAGAVQMGLPSSAARSMAHWTEAELLRGRVNHMRQRAWEVSAHRLPHLQAQLASDPQRLKPVRSAATQEHQLAREATWMLSEGVSRSDGRPSSAPIVASTGQADLSALATTASAPSTTSMSAAVGASVLAVAGILTWAGQHFAAETASRGARQDNADWAYGAPVGVLGSSSAIAAWSILASHASQSHILRQHQRVAASARFNAAQRAASQLLLACQNLGGRSTASVVDRKADAMANVAQVRPRALASLLAAATHAMHTVASEEEKLSLVQSPVTSSSLALLLSLPTTLLSTFVASKRMASPSFPTASAPEQSVALSVAAVPSMGSKGSRAPPRLHLLDDSEGADIQASRSDSEIGVLERLDDAELSLDDTMSVSRQSSDQAASERRSRRAKQRHGAQLSQDSDTGSVHSASSGTTLKDLSKPSTALQKTDALPDTLALLERSLSSVDHVGLQGSLVQQSLRQASLGVMRGMLLQTSGEHPSRAAQAFGEVEQTAIAHGERVALRRAIRRKNPPSSAEEPSEGQTPGAFAGPKPLGEGRCNLFIGLVWLSVGIRRLASWNRAQASLFAAEEAQDALAKLAAVTVLLNEANPEGDLAGVPPSALLQDMPGLNAALCASAMGLVSTENMSGALAASRGIDSSALAPVRLLQARLDNEWATSPSRLVLHERAESLVRGAVASASEPLHVFPSRPDLRFGAPLLHHVSLLVPSGADAARRMAWLPFRCPDVMSPESAVDLWEWSIARAAPVCGTVLVRELVSALEWACDMQQGLFSGGRGAQLSVVHYDAQLGLSARKHHQESLRGDALWAAPVSSQLTSAWGTGVAEPWVTARLLDQADVSSHNPSVRRRTLRLHHLTIEFLSRRVTSSGPNVSMFLSCAHAASLLAHWRSRRRVRVSPEARSARSAAMSLIMRVSNALGRIKSQPTKRPPRAAVARERALPPSVSPAVLNQAEAAAAWWVPHHTPAVSTAERVNAGQAGYSSFESPLSDDCAASLGHRVAPDVAEVYGLLDEQASPPVKGVHSLGVCKGAAPLSLLRGAIHLALQSLCDDGEDGIDADTESGGSQGPRWWETSVESRGVRKDFGHVARTMQQVRDLGVESLQTAAMSARECLVRTSQGMDAMVMSLFEAGAVTASAARLGVSGAAVDDDDDTIALSGEGMWIPHVASLAAIGEGLQSVCGPPRASHAANEASHEYHASARAQAAHSLESNTKRLLAATIGTAKVEEEPRPPPSQEATTVPLEWPASPNSRVMESLQRARSGPSGVPSTPAGMLIPFLGDRLSSSPSEDALSTSSAAATACLVAASAALRVASALIGCAAVLSESVDSKAFSRAYKAASVRGAQELVKVLGLAEHDHSAKKDVLSPQNWVGDVAGWLTTLATAGSASGLLKEAAWLLPVTQNTLEGDVSGLAAAVATSSCATAGVLSEFAAASLADAGVAGTMTSQLSDPRHGSASKSALAAATALASTVEGMMDGESGPLFRAGGCLPPLALHALYRALCVARLAELAEVSATLLTSSCPIQPSERVASSAFVGAFLSALKAGAAPPVGVMLGGVVVEGVALEGTDEIAGMSTSLTAQARIRAWAGGLGTSATVLPAMWCNPALLRGPASTLAVELEHLYSNISGSIAASVLWAEESDRIAAWHNPCGLVEKRLVCEGLAGATGPWTSLVAAAGAAGVTASAKNQAATTLGVSVVASAVESSVNAARSASQRAELQATSTGVSCAQASLFAAAAAAPSLSPSRSSVDAVVSASLEGPECVLGLTTKEWACIVKSVWDVVGPNSALALTSGRLAMVRPAGHVASCLAMACPRSLGASPYAQAALFNGPGIASSIGQVAALSPSKAVRAALRCAGVELDSSPTNSWARIRARDDSNRPPVLRDVGGAEASVKAGEESERPLRLEGSLAADLAVARSVFRSSIDGAVAAIGSVAFALDDATANCVAEAVVPAWMWIRSQDPQGASSLVDLAAVRSTLGGVIRPEQVAALARDPMRSHARGAPPRIHLSCAVGQAVTSSTAATLRSTSPYAYNAINLLSSSIVLEDAVSADPGMERALSSVSKGAAVWHAVNSAGVAAGLLSRVAACRHWAWKAGQWYLNGFAAAPLPALLATWSRCNSQMNGSQPIGSGSVSSSSLPSTLAALGPAVVGFALPQLIQALRHDRRGRIAVSLLAASQQSAEVAHRLLWLLDTEGKEAVTSDEGKLDQTPAQTPDAIAESDMPVDPAALALIKSRLDAGKPVESALLSEAIEASSGKSHAAAKTADPETSGHGFQHQLAGHDTLPVAARSLSQRVRGTMGPASLALFQYHYAVFDSITDISRRLKREQDTKEGRRAHIGRCLNDIFETIVKERISLARRRARVLAKQFLLLHEVAATCVAESLSYIDCIAAINDAAVRLDKDIPLEGHGSGRAGALGWAWGLIPEERRVTAARTIRRAAAAIIADESKQVHDSITKQASTLSLPVLFTRRAVRALIASDVNALAEPNPDLTMLEPAGPPGAALRPLLTLPFAPECRVISIELGSGRPMQSASKCPFMLRFRVTPTTTGLSGIRVVEGAASAVSRSEGSLRVGDLSRVHAGVLLACLGTFTEEMEDSSSITTPAPTEPPEGMETHRSEGSGSRVTRHIEPLGTGAIGMLGLIEPGSRWVDLTSSALVSLLGHVSMLHPLEGFDFDREDDLATGGHRPSGYGDDDLDRAPSGRLRMLRARGAMLGQSMRLQRRRAGQAVAVARRSVVGSLTKGARGFVRSVGNVARHMRSAVKTSASASMDAGDGLPTLSDVASDDEASDHPASAAAGAEEDEEEEHEGEEDEGPHAEKEDEVKAMRANLEAMVLSTGSIGGSGEASPDAGGPSAKPRRGVLGRMTSAFRKLKNRRRAPADSEVDVTALEGGSGMAASDDSASMTSTGSSADSTRDVASRIGDKAVIFKVFDDCRQDALAVQVIQSLELAFGQLDLGLFLRPYRVLPARVGRGAADGGMLEVVPDVVSLDEMGRGMGFPSVFHLFRARYGSPDSAAFETARWNLQRSLAAYAVVCYLLWIKDRHNGNILVDGRGHLIHIDFGFLLGISPGGNLGFETAAFKLTPQMISVMGGSPTTEPFYKFLELSSRAYLEARNRGPLLQTLIDSSADSGLPCFHFDHTLGRFAERLQPTSSALEAVSHWRERVHDARTTSTTALYDGIQRLQNGIHSEAFL
jgi:hypothetical protein